MHTTSQKNSICIIGSQRRNYTDIHMIKNAKKYFDSVFFIPIKAIRLEMIGDKLTPKYRDINIEDFGTIIMRIPQRYYDLAAVILDSLAGVTKIQSAESFRTVSNKVLMFKKLAKEGIKIPKICFITDPKSSQYALRKLNFPILVQNPLEKEKRTIANSSREAKDIIDTFESLNQPIILEETKKDSKIVKVYVAGNKVIRAISGNEMVILSKTKRKIAFSACKAIGTLYARIDMIDNNVIDVDISPLLQSVNRIDKKIVENIIKRIEYVSGLEKGGIVVRLIDDFFSIFR